MHGDHVGGLAEVFAAAPKAKYYAGEADITGIDTEADLTAVGDGDEVFGLHVVATPGHTAGHVSTFDPESGLFVAGDALTTANGMVTGPNPQFSSDHPMAIESVRKIAGLAVKSVLPGHVLPVEGDAGTQLRALATSL